MLKPTRRLFLAQLLLAALGPIVALAADASKTVTGYWAGTISAPRGELPFNIELVAAGEGKWKGTAECLPQGVRGFAFDTTKVNGSAIEFTLTGLPDDPRFSGQIAEDGASIRGELATPNGPLPFSLARSAKPAAQPDPNAVPTKGEAGKGLAGKWRGAISPRPGIELRLEADLQADAAGKIGGHMLSLDQGGSPIAIETLTEKDGAVQFDLPRIRGGFTGKLNADGSEITGEWSQGGRALPLVLKRLAVRN